VALSPHTDSAISLQPVEQAVKAAKGSVFYAVMEPKGTGPVLEALQTIAARPVIFSFGTVETDSGLAVQAADGAMGDVVGFAFLDKKVPPPFTREWSGGSGKHIHHKFVVVDFNGDKPAVFTGSSNLAAGGEKENGDSLIAIRDPAIASIFGIEAVRLYDHYSFRKRMKQATTVAPLSLWFPGKANQPRPWWRSAYDMRSIKFRDRCLFALIPLPQGLATVKNADWSALPKQAPKKKKTPAMAAARRKASVKR
jgi:phosphatidylserine/phosphatidylglycerophosphate/cardiolipin synthase-like enzyme